MTAPKLELLSPIRAAIIANSVIANLHPGYQGSRAIFTRRPVPADAPFPLTVVGPLVTRDNMDGINDFRPQPVVDITTYGSQPAHFRVVDDIAELIYGLFHRQRGAITVTNYGVTQIIASGPSPAPVDTARASTDDDKSVARRVTLQISLFAK